VAVLVLFVQRGGVRCESVAARHVVVAVIAVLAALMARGPHRSRQGMAACAKVGAAMWPPGPSRTPRNKREVRGQLQRTTLDLDWQGGLCDAPCGRLRDSIKSH